MGKCVGPSGVWAPGSEWRGARSVLRPDFGLSTRSRITLLSHPKAPLALWSWGHWQNLHQPCPSCHGLVAMTGYLDLHFPYQTADPSFSINDLVSSHLPIVVARCFFTLLVPSPSFLSFQSPSGTFHSRLPYVPLPSSSFCALPTCSS